MTELSHAKSFRHLAVYQKARKVSRAIFEVSKGFPKSETFGSETGGGIDGGTHGNWSNAQFHDG